MDDRVLDSEEKKSIQLELNTAFNCSSYEFSLAAQIILPIWHRQTKKKKSRQCRCGCVRSFADFMPAPCINTASARSVGRRGSGVSARVRVNTHTHIHTHTSLIAFAVAALVRTPRAALGRQNERLQATNPCDWTIKCVRVSARHRRVPCKLQLT